MAVKAGQFLVRLPSWRLRSLNLDEVRRQLRSVGEHEHELSIAELGTHPQGLLVTLLFRPDQLGWSTEALRRVVADVLPEASIERFGVDHYYGAAVLDRADAVDTRHVNTLIAESGTEVAPDGPLNTATDYDVLVHIGRYDHRSLLPHGHSRFPAEFLPDRGLWLRAVLVGDRAGTEAERWCYLPREGESFACGCPPEGEHQPDCVPSRWTRLPFRTPAAAGDVHYQVLIYYGIAIVHTHSLDLPVGLVGRQPTATVTFQLTRDYADLDDRLDHHAASFFVSDADAKLVVNQASGPVVAFDLHENAADVASLRARDLLYRIHYPKPGQNVYDEHCSRDQAGFEADLRQLAWTGAELYDALFEGHTRREMFTAFLRQEAAGRGRPPMIQIVHPRRPRLPMVWSAVYGLPLGDDPAEFTLCRSVREYGPGSAPAEIPVVCPYQADHPRSGVVCLFGFWGLGAVLEQLPRAADRLPARREADYDPLSVQLALGPDLAEGIVRSHLGDLRRLPDLCVADLRPAKSQLEDAWRAESMDVVYVLSHCDYRGRPGALAADRVFRFDGYLLAPETIRGWVAEWPRRHWSLRKPLVLLNACHTVERSSRTLSNFVDQFVNGAGASGVVGTEITVDQRVAGLAATELIGALNAGATVGEAVRAMRWALVRRGNLMGLAYTPYSLGNLRLRDARRSSA